MIKYKFLNIKNELQSFIHQFYKQLSKENQGEELKHVAIRPLVEKFIWCCLLLTVF